METIRAFVMGRACRNDPSMVFDWHKAATLIHEQRPSVAGAGLAGDWEWTGGVIYRDGKPVPKKDTYTFLASTWATPEVSLDGETSECFVAQNDSPGWDSETYWPESALAILNGDADS